MLWSWIENTDEPPQILHPASGPQSDWGLDFGFEPVQNSFGCMLRVIVLLQGEPLHHF